ncbi:hypothetical protein GCM10023191_063330 [Actinoallomurus oryzae]|uniref:Uncharacterized protein n=1 Tax=Actinoallomurus oryzae TaxID=502180 RepID=A0ABP8QS80_9ACTN
MESNHSAPAFRDDTATDYGIPVTLDAEAKIDVLAEIVNDLLATLVNDGRMSRAEERTWRAATDAVVLDRPELIAPGGIIIAEAEQITRSACHD